jgi:predicted protein tyrosine phosphatase
MNKTINHYTDFYNAEKFAKDYDAVISLGHYLAEEFREGKKYLSLNFGDETFGSIAADSSGLKHAPKESHIRQALTFIRNLHPEEKLLVHCFAGYSRSPAVVAMAICERDKVALNIALGDLADNRIPDKLIPSPNDIVLHEYLMIK